MSTTYKTLRLKDGRDVSYVTSGKGKRKAIFFHGHPGSRHQISFLTAHVDTHDLEVASFDRPGYGNSSPESDSTHPLDLSEQVAALADELGWKKFHLIAVSGGGPYALKCASVLGKRVLSAQIICGLGPLHEKELRKHFRRRLYGAMRLALMLPSPLLHGFVQNRLQALFTRTKAGTKPVFMNNGDFALIGSSEIKPQLRASLEAAFRQGVEGSKRDIRAFLAPWQVDWAAISCPVVFTHGLDDQLVPWQFSEALAARIPGARFVSFKNEGHYTLPIMRGSEILKEIQ